MIRGAAISRSPEKQPIVALSTGRTEYTAFSEARREILWLRQILLGIEPRGNQTNESDSSSHTIYMPTTKHADSEGITARTKNFYVRLQHSRDLQHKGMLKFTYTKSSRNTADIFTKWLHAPAHRQHKERLGLSEAARETLPTTMRR